MIYPDSTVHVSGFFAMLLVVASLYAADNVAVDLAPRAVHATAHRWSGAVWLVDSETSWYDSRISVVLNVWFRDDLPERKRDEMSMSPQFLIFVMKW